MQRQKSYILKAEAAEKRWFLIDATDKVVGRLATEIANILRGKISPKYTPNTDSGDFVVVVNAEKVRFTGNKLEDKNYYWHSGYIGGIKKRTAKEQLGRHPELILMDAVKGMLQKSSQGRKHLTKLKVFVGPTHTHESQNPIPYQFKK